MEICADCPGRTISSDVCNGRKVIIRLIYLKIFIYYFINIKIETLVLLRFSNLTTLCQWQCHLIINHDISTSSRKHSASPYPLSHTLISLLASNKFRCAVTVFSSFPRSVLFVYANSKRQKRAPSEHCVRGKRRAKRE